MSNMYIDCINIALNNTKFGDMLNPRSSFYALAIAWDFSKKQPFISKQLPLSLSYENTRRYKGKPECLFSGDYICEAMHLSLFAYQCTDDKLEHKRLLRTIQNKINNIIIKSKEKLNNSTPEGFNYIQKQMYKHIEEEMKHSTKSSYFKLYEGKLDDSFDIQKYEQERVSFRLTIG